MTLSWPSTCPAWMRTALDTLAAQGRLHGVAPQVLAAMCWYTSQCGIHGLGVNGTGFGGFFGQHVTWPYPSRPQGFSAQELTTPTTFITQVTVAAATLVSYREPTLGAALSTYARGTTIGWQKTGLVAFVQTTGADVYGPVTTPAPPPQEEDTAMLTALAVGGQIHLWVTTPAAKTVRHWWQATEGPTAGKWRGPETLPS